MSLEVFGLAVLGVIAIVATIICAREWIAGRKKLAAEELAALAAEDVVLDTAAQTLAELKPVVDPLCEHLAEAETQLAAADANLIKCRLDGPNHGFGWPALLANVVAAEESFEAVHSAVNTHQQKLVELHTALTDCDHRLWNDHHLRTYAGQNKVSELRARERELIWEMPRVPHIDWLPPLKDKALPEDVAARAEARHAAREAAEEERRRRASSCSSCYSSS